MPGQDYLKIQKSAVYWNFPKRNSQDLDRLAESLKRLNSLKPKYHILCGDFNCPDIIWDSLTVSTDPKKDQKCSKVQDRSIQQQLIDLSVEFDLTQIHDQPTRNGNLLDLVFTTDQSFINVNCCCLFKTNTSHI